MLRFCPRFASCLLFTLAFPCLTLAQAPPATDIYLVEISAQRDKIELGAPSNITRRDGYDNQPFFLADSKSLLYASLRDGQADIYRYDVDKQTHQALTQTSESEYSPTLMPDGEHFSVVRVELDTSLVQRLWRFPLQGGQPELLIAEVNPAGYHAWGDAQTVSLFVLGNPPTLQRYDFRTRVAQMVVSRAGTIGRSLHRLPNRRAVSFLHRISDTESWIKTVDLDNGEFTTLTRPLEGNEFYAWMPDGSMLMARDSRLYCWRASSPAEWQLVADLQNAGLAKITRLAVSPDSRLLALVVNQESLRLNISRYVPKLILSATCQGAVTLLMKPPPHGC